VKTSPRTTIKKSAQKSAPVKKSSSQDEQSIIHADWFYRVSDGWKYFGYRNSILHKKIESGEIPKPIALSDGGRARGWFGRVIIAWQQGREAKSALKLVVGEKKAPAS
jgi:predicted DNA-binding transcriptional regulator AlpA